MAQSTYGAPLYSEEGETKALTTTAGYLAVKPGWNEVKMYSDSQWRIAHSPVLKHVIYYLASTATYTDYTPQATDRSSSTHVPLDGMVATDYLYLGTSEPVLGFYFDMGSNVNATATSSLDMEYCSTAVGVGSTIAFTDVAGDSDGTSSGGVTLAQDGVYTFTLVTPAISTLGTSAAVTYDKCYWYRFTPNKTISSPIDINEIIPVYKNTNYGYREPGIEYSWSIPTNRVGGFVLVGSTTQTLDVTWIKHQG